MEIKNDDITKFPLTTTIGTETSMNSTTEFCSDRSIISQNNLETFIQSATVFLLIFTLLSSIFQIFIINVAWNLIKKGSGDKCLHIFLLSMTIADFLLTGIAYPIELGIRVLEIENVNKHIMIVMHGLCWVGMIISSISLVFMNLEKLVFFKLPLSYSLYFTQQRVVVTTILSWIGSILFVVFAWLTGLFSCVNDSCTTLGMFSTKIHVYIAFIIIVSIIPTTTSLLVGIYIMKLIKNHTKQIAEEATLFNTVNNEGSNRSNSINNSKCEQKSSNLVAIRLKTFYYVFITSIFTALTLLPYRLINIERAINPSAHRTCLTILIYWILVYMVYCNSIFNPLITLTVLPQYRRKFLRFLCFCHYKSRSGEKFQIRSSIGDI
ncbi:G protein-coupled receptor, rhodopsin-like family and GPCR, rhodopsin-like, 7TM domain-containing protein [Strongyloides ratti]|uniref:G protein-coupled receptor, rhodopsin-like family and GPCR, rhodopsin-like, 7TM domain-containing protein n=1 Tax=Strongyloides ratti TaxID=34506 RepID=A0A090KXD7_STRRB|nr:G protein-coupled receptor, rhodopsin-like family and GPCR, rhodopsin-like, 7TM domain-containing protein [Strongyloides ratti]CEF62081.1 G protein-coupled receptor, rhodopsin-like family and GPCR, rhodopsin-like, 7TM domain-containing protein [Strongyloides ratti]